jgi:hypothetical protein
MRIESSAPSGFSTGEPADVPRLLQAQGISRGVGARPGQRTPAHGGAFGFSILSVSRRRPGMTALG